MVKPVRRRAVAPLKPLPAAAVEPEHPEVIDLGALRFDCHTRSLARRPPNPPDCQRFRSVRALTPECRTAALPAEIREAVRAGAATSSRTLDTHICRIRDKLELTPRNGWRLAAVYGYGYRLQQVATSASRLMRRLRWRDLSSRSPC
jgi:DNA-binding response OmpR family regulator